MTDQPNPVNVLAKRIVLLRFTCFPDCIGEVVAENETMVTFRKLRQLVYRQLGQGQVNIGFDAFYLPAEDCDFPLPRSMIFVMVDAPAKIADTYSRSVSPIQVAQSVPSPGGNGNIVIGDLRGR